MERIILHSDMNAFYASVECLYHPEIRAKPVAVGGSAERRHGIVLAKNELARAQGVRTGETLWQARQKCPELVLIPPDFNKYLRYSKMAREIYGEFSDRVESFGLDEAWIDVTDSISFAGDGARIADAIRKKVKFELGVTVSVGVSFNKIFAKLGSDMKKPDATTLIPRDRYRTLVWPLPVEELLFVGRATQSKLARCGITTIGGLANADRRLLQRLLGKNGLTLWTYANGLDASPVARQGERPPVKSIGNSTTTPRDLVTEQDVRITLYVLCESVAARLREHGLRCSIVQISIRDNTLRSYERQGKLAASVCTSRALFDRALALYRSNPPAHPVRSLGVRACGLSGDGTVQLSLLPEITRLERDEQLERALDDIRSRFGHFSIRRGLMLADHTLSDLNPQGDHIIHPEVFFS